MNENIKMAQDILKLQAERTSFKTMAEYVRDYLVDYAETDSEFVQKVQDKEKSFVGCIAYIKKMAMEWLREEAKMEVSDYGNGIGGDVPNEICFGWAVEYYYSKPEEKKVPEPKTSNSNKKSKAKKVEKKAPEDSQLSFMDMAAVAESKKSEPAENVSIEKSESENNLNEEIPKDDNIVHLETVDSSLDYSDDDCDAEELQDDKFSEDFFVDDLPYMEVN